MVKNHSDSERGNPLPPHRLLFPINSKGSFIFTTELHLAPRIETDTISKGEKNNNKSMLLIAFWYMPLWRRF